MSTIRNGQVRVTSSDVHKWERAEKKQTEYEYVPDYSGRVLFVGLLVVAAVILIIIRLS